MEFILILAIAVIIFLGRWVYRLNNEKIETIQVNSEIAFQNGLLQQELINNKKELENVESVLSTQKNILESLHKTEQEMRQGAEKRAEEWYENKRKEFYTQLNEYQASTAAEIEKEIAAISLRKEKELSKLKDLEDKQLVYIKAQQRQEEMNLNEDYYRLVLTQADLDDITLLRELQLRFCKKEAIDKLIWETYYKPAYDTLMSHLFKTSTTKICGIYKITNLTNGKAYIGQSVDIRERFRQHIKSSLAYGGTVNKLYQTMQQSGQTNFAFDILEQVPRDKLNEREAYWIDFYKTKQFGLNSTKGNSV